MRTACLLLAFVVSALAQTQTTRLPFVRAVGQASVSVTPDQAKIDFSVTTQSSTAQDAGARNAAQTTTLITALQSLLGMNADIRTIGYSLNAVYSYPQGQPAVLTGFVATNTVEVTITDITAVGKVIDTGIQAGATQVSGLTFGLQNDQPARTQALKLATAQAKSNADAMASGLGMHTGAVQTIQEGASVSPVLTPVLGASVNTPVQVGTVSVSATVTAEFAITP
jgi:uncharacterized protein YggE